MESFWVHFHRQTFRNESVCHIPESSASQSAYKYGVSVVAELLFLCKRRTSDGSQSPRVCSKRGGEADDERRPCWSPGTPLACTSQLSSNSGVPVRWRGNLPQERLNTTSAEGTAPTAAELPSLWFGGGVGWHLSKHQVV